MKILLINKFHYNRGGSETYYFALAEALKANGHEVVCFAMQDPQNLPCDQKQYFVPNVDYNNASGIGAKIKAAKSLFYSKIAGENMEKLIEVEHPDIAHIGLLHRQITFSVVDVLKKHHIPVVMTMHDLIFACPNYTMLANGSICEECVNGSVMNCIKKKCVKGSLLKSVLAAFEKIYLLKKHYYHKIDLYITECDYYNTLMKKSGVTNSRIITMRNFLPINQKYEFNRDYRDYILYFGRFSAEKGILTLLEAHKDSECRRKLVIVGSGPILPEIEKYICEDQLINIELPGPIYGEEMEEIIEGAKTVVVPSEWYENCPYALLQSLAKGKIVIASRIGGLPELIEDGVTGFLFEPGNAKELSERIEKVFSMSKDAYEDMSLRIVEKAKENHGWKQYVAKLLLEYDLLIKNTERYERR